MSGIDTRLLRYFAAAVDEQRFGRAALRLDITPPTLMDQIKKLEKPARREALRASSTKP
jgi:DNA-binding transcriptional LysR family regulator